MSLDRSSVILCSNCYCVMAGCSREMMIQVTDGVAAQLNCMPCYVGCASASESSEKQCRWGVGHHLHCFSEDSKAVAPSVLECSEQGHPAAT
jgi:hypothetical protein